MAGGRAYEAADGLDVRVHQARVAAGYKTLCGFEGYGQEHDPQRDLRPAAAEGQDQKQAEHEIGAEAFLVGRGQVRAQPLGQRVAKATAATPRAERAAKAGEMRRTRRSAPL